MDLEQLKTTAEREIAASDDVRALDEVRVRFLGKKGQLTQQLKQLGKLPADQRPVAGQQINLAKKILAELIDTRRNQLESVELHSRLKAEAVDVTQPARG